jgi:hypothetical protein
LGTEVEAEPEILAFTEIAHGKAVVFFVADFYLRSVAGPRDVLLYMDAGPAPGEHPCVVKRAGHFTNQAPNTDFRSIDFDHIFPLYWYFKQGKQHAIKTYDISRLVVKRSLRRFPISLALHRDGFLHIFG